ncbi:unnamed protein product [Urochloa decumbens]|uniref:Uncharacterized protein n=1 Tax=Urochloa decumbens TaxID=240449 RepID=A0ABC9E3Y3_9POAL
MEREGVPNYLGEQEAAAVAAPDERRRVERPHAAEGQLFLDAGRVLMLWGWGALAAVSTAASSQPDLDASSSAVHALFGLVLWLAGVFLVALVFVAHRRFPRAVLVGAVVVASAVTGCFFPPRN